LNDSISPVFCFAILCCSAVNIAIVSFIFVSGAGSEKTHCIGGATMVDGMTGIPTYSKLGDKLSPTKFAAVIPDPCSAATTSSRLVFSPDWTLTANIT